MKKIIKSKIFSIVMIAISAVVVISDFAMGTLFKQKIGGINKIVFNQVKQMISDEKSEHVAIRSVTPSGQTLICELDTKEDKITTIDRIQKYGHRSESLSCIYGNEGQVYSLEFDMAVFDFSEVAFLWQVCRYDNGKRTVIVEGLPGLKGGLIYDEGELYAYAIDSEDSHKIFFFKIDEENHQYEDAGVMISENREVINITTRNGKSFVIYDDGSLELLHVKGENEMLLEADTSIANCNSILNVEYIGEELYALGGIGGEKLFKLSQGKAEEICNLSGLKMQLSKNNLSYITMDGGVAMTEYNGNILVYIGDYICLIDVNGNLLKNYNSMELPMRDTMYNWGRILRIIFSCGMLLLGIFLLFANCFQWRLTLLARNLLVFPLIIMSILGVTWFLTRAMRELGEEEQKTALLFASSYAQKIIDAKLIESVDDYGDIQRKKGARLQEAMDELYSNFTETHRYRFGVYKKLDDSSYALLYNSTTKKLSLNQLKVTIPYFSMEKYNDTYFQLYDRFVDLINDRCMVAVQKIRNDEGKEIGVIVFYISENKALNSSSMSLYMVIVVPFLILILLFIILTNRYVLRNIRKVSTAVSNISQGDYENKIEVIAKDELGDICVGVNNMAQQIQKVQDAIITGMATMVENRDSNTGGHIKRTSLVVRIFANVLLEHAEELGIDAHYIYNVAKAAPMHDLGKIAVEDAILRKPGKFTDEEYEKMKAHSSEGATIVSKILEEVDDQEFVNIAINVAHYHHEKWNGTGYPDKIQRENIPLEARIMALADVFDALVSKRCYKDAIDYDRAFKIIEADLGTHFDPNLGVLFLSCRPQLEELYNGIEH